MSTLGELGSFLAWENAAANAQIFDHPEPA
jgi:hypothetical protein